MEEEREEREEGTQSGTTSTQAETPPPSCAREGDELCEPEEDRQADCGASDGEAEPSQAGEDQHNSGAESSEGTLTPTATQESTDCLPEPPLPAEDEFSPPSESSHPSNSQNHSSDPCFYCLRSLDSDYRPEAAKQEDSDPSAALPSSGQKLSYQTDPRPHFGVACSSHSTCRPLWGSEGPCWGQRLQEMPDQTDTCPHCHLGLPLDTLRWHEAKCLLFEGLRNAKK
ncbi:uncharacterized protein LOC115395735 [Salarias fasciatus]|uniref:uncharacterized protein LOC115395735 n=1 Tax=Salarias fasciatus TaxID=181472 RepID=UPI00117685D7|nr:uncharacterized protein LOC115395735 [Salarias fasciatus]